MLKEDVVKFNDVVYANFGIMTKNLFGDSPLNKFDFFVTDIFVYSLWQLAGWTGSYEANRQNLIIYNKTANHKRLFSYSLWPKFYF